MTAQSFPLAEMYDRITLEGRYFNYPLAARRLAKIFEWQRLLELCIGTGSVALELEKLGFTVSGIDRDDAMLALLRTKLAAAGSHIRAVKDSAEDFHIHAAFDGVYIHSGHLIFNWVRGEAGADEFRLNVPSRESADRTFKSVSKVLGFGGKFVINVERWTNLSVTLSDGSTYKRFVLEEEPTYGSRVHLFYDASSGATSEEVPHRMPKLSYEEVCSLLTLCGFGDFQINRHLFVATYLGT